MGLKELQYEGVNWIWLVERRDGELALVSIAVDFSGSKKFS
jgi:superoxide dismutase